MQKTKMMRLSIAVTILAMSIMAYYFKNETMQSSSATRKILYGLLIGLVVSLGFVVLFAFIGIFVSYFGRDILKYSGWIEFFVGIFLVIIGAVFLFDINSRIIRNKYVSFFVYGMGFAIASVSCTLPILLLIVTSSVKTSGLGEGILVFLSYAGGMSLFMVFVHIDDSSFQDGNRINNKEIHSLYLQAWLLDRDNSGDLSHLQSGCL